MKRWVGVALAVALGGAACAHTGTPAGTGLTVVGASAPFSELAARVGGDLVSVTTVAPPGAEAHDLEPDARAIEAISRADLVVYLGGAFQPAVARAARARPSIARLDLSRNSPTLEPGAHLWLDIEQMRAWVREVRDRLTRIAPEHTRTFAANAVAYDAELLALDARFRAGLRDCTHRVMVVTHAAFSALAERYELRQESLAGSAPESEPDPARLANIVHVVRREGLTTVFSEPGAPPRVAQALARETGARIAILDPLEMTPAKRADTYLVRMGRNLDALRAGLGCR